MAIVVTKYEAGRVIGYTAQEQKITVKYDPDKTETIKLDSNDRTLLKQIENLNRALCTCKN